MGHPKKILLGIQEGYCNLKCPKCYTHGSNKVSSNERSRGYMNFESFIRILDEVKEFKPRIAPQTWDEPFLNPKFFDYLKEIKDRDLTVTIDTNGLLLKDSDLMRLIELQIDSVFFSVDAFLPATYEKVRGVAKHSQLLETIHRFLELRGDHLKPRIGVSFVVEDDNQSEVEDFVEYWTLRADVVRVNQQFEQGRKLKTASAQKRTACWSLDDSLMIHHNGAAALCCVDTHYENLIGNVFEVGVKQVWDGLFFKSARKAHEQGEFDKLKICASCDLWSHDQPLNEKTENLLISKTNSHTYYNRLDRMENFKMDNRFV